MGEVMLRTALPRKRVCSAGIAALVGRPADASAVQLMAERGLDLSSHRARQLDEGMLTQSDLVMTMDTGQVEWIESRWPQAKGRIYRWGHWSHFDIPDPYRADIAEFRGALELIDRGLEDWLGRL